MDIPTDIELFFKERNFEMMNTSSREYFFDAKQQIFVKKQTIW